VSFRHCTAILLVKSSADIRAFDHVVNVVDYEKDRFIGLDYPNFDLSVDKERLAKFWDGAVLLVSPRRSTTVATVLAIASFLGIALAGAILGYRRRTAAALKLAA
jgi:hypothetical protein